MKKHSRSHRSHQSHQSHQSQSHSRSHYTTKRLFKFLKLFMVLMLLLGSILVEPTASKADGNDVTYLFNKSSLEPGTERWSLVGAPLGEFTPGIVNFDNYTDIQAYADGHERSFKFQVDTAGNYQVKLQGMLNQLGGIGELYIDNQSIGTFDFYDDAYWENQFESGVRTIRLMHLEAGQHTLTFKAIGHSQGSTRRNMHPTKLILEAAEGPLPVSEVAIKTELPNMSLGMRTQLRIEAILTDNTRVALEGVQVSYTSADPTIAAVNPLTGWLEAAGVGDTTISASVLYYGTTYTASLSVHVQKSVTYLFNKSSLEPGSEWWKLVGAPLGEFTPGIVNFDTYTDIQAYADGHERSFKFKVGAAGNYQIKLQGMLNQLGGIGELYIDNQPIGTFDFYDDAYWENQFESGVRTIRLMHLEAGQHTLTFKAIGHAKGSTRRNMHPTKLILDALEGQLDISQVAIKQKTASPDLSIGARVQLMIEAELTDGTRIPLDGAQVSYTSANPAIATVDSSTGWLEAIGVGDTTISASVVYYGTTYTASLPVHVQKSATYLFNKSSLEPGTDRWKLVGAPLGEFTPGIVNFDNYTDIQAYADGHERTFIFKVGASGNYLVKLQGMVNQLGGIGELVIDGRTIGTFDFYDDAYWENQFESGVRTIRLMHLETGTHELTFRAIGHAKGSTRRNMHPTKFILEAVEGPVQLSSMTIKWALPEMTAGMFNQIAVDTEAVLIDGTKAFLEGVQLSYQSADTTIAVVDAQSGRLEAKAAGETTITVSAAYGGNTYTSSLPLKVKVLTNTKTRTTLYTQADIQAARDNIDQYAWAQSMRDNAVTQANLYADQGLDFLWSLVPPQSLPRSIFVNQELGSPITGKDIDLYGYYPYTFDPINEPWKITDPSSGAKFPTNDFGAFYESGLDEHGIFDPTKADRSLLYNTDHPDPNDPLHTWGVDDGRGWVDENGNYFTFIAYYVHWGLWGYNGKSAIQKAMQSLRDAYLYTGDIKYARAGTVLLDRIADVYPSLDISKYGMTNYFNSHGGSGLGKAVGNIWEPFLVKDFISAYDAFYPAMDDPQLISFLSAKSQTYDLGQLKYSATGIRKNIEAGIIERIFPGIKNAQIASNNGIHQSALAMAAVVYDKLPESQAWMDFNFKSGGEEGSPLQVTGGNMGVTFVNGVDRDGVGHESSPGYNELWLNAYLETADIMAKFQAGSGVNLYDNVKFRKMFSGLYPLMLGQKYTANIGDASGTGNPWLAFSLQQMVKAFETYGDPIFAQLAYFRNNNSTAGIHGNVFSANAQQIAADIQAVIQTHGLLKLDSVNMTGFGFTALRDGDIQEGQSPGTDKLRDLWMYHGRNYGHGHGDTLNLGLISFGLDVSPDLGYPESTQPTDTHFTEWIRQTISHNTVLVDQKMQAAHWGGEPKQFDDQDMVKVMDVEAPDVYPQTELYKRTTAMIHVDDANSYVVDFFRVKGGSEHHFSFHGAEGDVTVEGLNMVTQQGGSYAGASVPFGQRPSDANGVGYQYTGSGFHYLKNVERDTAPSSQYSVDWDIKDTWHVLAQPEDIHLRLTMLGDVNEVALADGIPSRTQTGNPEKLRYMVAKRSGTNLNSNFTSVIEPYKDQRFITSSSALEVKAGGTIAADIDVRAVKVTLENGREDYIISALNPNVTYTIAGKLQFKGSFGVYSELNGQPVYSYVNDGTVIGLIGGTPEISAELGSLDGTVVDFTKALQVDNKIVVQMNLLGHPASDLVNRTIYVQNDGLRNAVYLIKGITDLGNGTYSLDLGDTTLIRSYKNDNDFSQGFIYDIAAGAGFRIPLSYVWQEEPVPVVPAAPQNVQAQAGNGAAALSWSASADTVSYSVYWTQGAASAAPGDLSLWNSQAGITGLTHTVSGLTNGQTYTFVVKAVNTAGSSAASAAVEATPSAPAGERPDEGTGTPVPSSSPAATAKADSEGGFQEGIQLAINGELENGKAGNATVESKNNKKVTTVTVDEEKLNGLLAAAAPGYIVSIEANNGSDIVAGELNARMLRTMAGKAAILELKTESAGYKLPAELINIADLLAQLGIRAEADAGAETGTGTELEAGVISEATLGDIILRVEIANLGKDLNHVVPGVTGASGASGVAGASGDSGGSGGSGFSAPLISFKVTATYKGKTVAIGTFNDYVERMIVIPDGVDVGMVTTGVLIMDDGTAHHVPTRVVSQNGKNQALMKSMTNSTYTVIHKEKTFDDITKHWGRAAIEDLASRFVIQGVDDSHFMPDKEITRAEFVTIAVKALGLREGRGSQQFSDVTHTDWYYDAVNDAVSYGLLEGYADGTFKPAQRITREEAMVIAARVMKLVHMELKLEPALEEQLLSQFADSANFSSWARQSAALNMNHGIINGADGNVRPQDFISRAETATVMQLLLQKSGLITVQN
ncbi:S-layer homology domain-containing protein [Paenibacillus eucommiae]|uniref:Uncharacterized protein YjdB n=1 Tax=Paenibacillus eucommiae TaxID=1355755 RepID=A0ABS4J3W5_9BACL|nr:S-layer homology domain-containing protein [Paenibacillus eucommiae]MBP1993791.1 uncharacterized protein YjdB [Paenibacillus eucommiae]